jgi:hypothetical protein
MSNKSLLAWRGTAMLAAVLLPAAAVSADSGLHVNWINQFGTSTVDYGYSAAMAGSGNAYVAGETWGSLGGPSAGVEDAFLRKYDEAGNVLWTRQLGTNYHDHGYSVAADANGNAYLAGTTSGSLGGPNAGDTDAYLAKYDAVGTSLWTRQLGTVGSEFGRCATTDIAGNVYVTGDTQGGLGGANSGLYDLFLAKYDGSGTRVWVRQFGTSSSEFCYSVATDADSNAYVTGVTQGSLASPNSGGYDVFLAKYDTQGNRLWTRQAGTSDDEWSRSVAVDSAGNSYVTGYTKGSLGGLNAGGFDVFLAKYDTTGNRLWMSQLGTSSDDIGLSVDMDSADKVYVGGGTSGSLAGPNAGGSDAFVAKYDGSGNLLEVFQFGSNAYDTVTCVGLDNLGSGRIADYSYGTVGDASAGNYDAFVASVASIPEPSTLALLSIGALGLLAYAWRKRKPA